MAFTPVANQPVDNSVSGIEVYSLAVSGGTLFVTINKVPNGPIDGMTTSFVAAGATANDSLQTVNNAAATVLSAANLVGGPILRTGMTAARTDTTDTAAAIIAAWSGAGVGSSRVVEINNQSAFPETIQAGAGVTVAGSAVIPANSTGSFLMVYTGTGAVTLTRINSSSQAVPNVIATALNATVGVLPAGAITGAKMVVLTSSNAVPGAQTTRTAAQMLADIPGAAVGFSWLLRVINTGAGVFTLTADGSVTLTGTATVAQNTFRDFVCTITGAATATISEAGKGTND